MNLIVADTSPLSMLIRIGCIDVLPELFDAVVVPMEVARELSHPRSPASIQTFIANPPTWFLRQQPLQVIHYPTLHQGEDEAIALALQLQSLLLVDEARGRTIAQSLNIPIIGGIGILERAAKAGSLADLDGIHQRIRNGNFRIHESMLNISLKRHQAYLLSNPSPGL